MRGRGGEKEVLGEGEGDGEERGGGGGEEGKTGLGIQGGGIKAVDYVCDGFDGAVPARSRLCQLE